MNNLVIIRELLADEWKTLRHQWLTTEQQWQDRVQDRFRREFWEEYERVVPAVLKEIGYLEQVIAQTQREVP